MKVGAWARFTYLANVALLYEAYVYARYKRIHAHLDAAELSMVQLLEDDGYSVLRHPITHPSLTNVGRLGMVSFIPKIGPCRGRVEYYAPTDFSALHELGHAIAYIKHRVPMNQGLESEVVANATGAAFIGDPLTMLLYQRVRARWLEVAAINCGVV